MATLSAHLFGRLRVQWRGQVLERPGTGKTQELLCYLLVHRSHPHSREALVDLLWSDIPAAQSRKYLRQTLWQLQAALGSEDGPDAGRLLVVEPDWVQLNADADLWLDVAVFEQASAAVQGTPGHRLTADEARCLREAAQLYQGDLLAGWYQEWCLFERQRLQDMYLSGLHKLTSYCEAHREFESGLAYGALILHYDRASERAHRRLMRLHYLAGDRTAALRQYEHCVVALREELGARPSKTTTALHEMIRADRLPGATLPEDEVRAAHGASTSVVTEALDQLQQVRTLLAEVQQQTQQHIQALKALLDSQRSTDLHL